MKNNISIAVALLMVFPIVAGFESGTRDTPSQLPDAQFRGLAEHQVNNLIGDVLIISIGHTDDTLATKTYFEANMPYTFDVFWAETEVPELSLLQQYNVVLLFENGISQNSEPVGNVVYNYYISGGNIVLATFYWQERGDNDWDHVGWGNLESIDPFTSIRTTTSWGNNYAPCTLNGSSIVPHALTNGVSALTVNDYCGGVEEKPEAVVVARWDNGEPAIGYVENQCQRIVGVTMFPPMEGYSGFAGDFYQAFENAISFADKDCGQIPEFGLLAGGIAVIGAIGGFFLLRRRD